MQTERQQVTEKKRVLTKIRHNFLNKKQEDDQALVADPSARFISDNTVYALSVSHGLVEVNRKIYISQQYMSQYHSVYSSAIKENRFSKTLVLSLCPNQKNQIIPYQYIVKRLESYGDLELATWAHKILKYYNCYSKLVDNSVERYNTEDLEVYTNIKETVKRISKEIEDEYPYYKVVRHYGRSSCTMTELSYSENFLKEMGHTIESLLECVKDNKLPHVFDPKCLLHHRLLKCFYENCIIKPGVAYQGKDHETFIIDSNGMKKEVIIQTIHLMEPVEEGFLSVGYYVLKGSAPKKYAQSTQEFFKCRKNENE